MFEFRNRHLDRRSMLRGMGACVALPTLTAMRPALATPKYRDEESVKRFVAICGGLGFHTPNLFPTTPGADYEWTPYLSKLAEHRDRLTVFSGLSHPEQNGNNGHASAMTWLTSARRPGLAGFKNSISLDQQIAIHLSGKTRFPYLSLANSGQSLSWTSGGVNIPAQSSPRQIFESLFINGSQQEVANQVNDLRRGKSILDTVRDEANKLNRTLGHRDQEKLSDYFSSIRDLETQMQQAESWVRRPKPAVDAETPKDVADKHDVVARQRLLYDMIALALQTDSTRVVTLMLGGMNAPPSNIPGVATDWHNLSHHGRDEAKIRELQLIEEAEFAEFARFLGTLRRIGEGDSDLLRQSAILFGSNLGNASAHDWRNLPIILAGGEFRHGQYVAHNPDDNTPLANLFVPLMHRMGIEADSFGSSTAASIRGLDWAG